MSVAIITRTKNRSLLLTRAIESVLNQKYQDWTHVIVNDGGPQTEIESLLDPYREQYRGRLKILHRLNSLGMEAASNAGIRASESKYIVIHDDDDTWDKQFLSSCIAHLEKSTNPLAKGVICSLVIVSEKIENNQVIQLKTMNSPPCFRGIPTLYQMLASNYIIPISFIFCRETLKEIGYFDETLPVIGDWDFHLRFLKHYDIEYLDQPLAYYHHRIDIKSPTDSYGNSLIAGQDLHQTYRIILFNRYLQKDLQSGQMGLGVLLHMISDLQKIQNSNAILLQYINQIKRLLLYNQFKKIFHLFKKMLRLIPKALTITKGILRVHSPS